MSITKLRLKNYRQHHDTVIEFVPGINTIVGSNNAGKSTIPEAIEFALFGAKALRDSGSSWITDGQKAGSAILSLDLGEVEYRVGRDANAAKVYRDKDPEPVADYKANVTKYVSQLTGVNHAGFRLGHYVRQKELAAFSALRPGKRQEAIEKMLKIHAVDKALSLLKIEGDNLDAQLKTLLVTSQDVTKLTDSLMEAEIERASLIPIEVDSTKVDVLQAELTASKIELATLESRQSEIRNLELALKDFSSLSTAFDDSSKAFETFKPSIIGSLSQLQDKLKELQSNKLLSAKMSTIKAELEKELIEVVQPVAPDSTEHSKVQAEISAASLNLKTVSKLAGLTSCPTCLSDITNVSEVISNLTEKLQVAEDIARPIIEDYKASCLEYTKQQSLYTVYISEAKRRASLAASYVEVEFSQEDEVLVEKEIAQIRADDETYSRLKHVYEMTKQKYDRAIADKERLNSLTQEQIPENQLMDLRLKVAIIDEKLVDAQTQLKADRAIATQILTNIAQLDGRIQELSKSLESAKTLKQQISDTAENLGRVKYKSEVYQKFKKYLTAKIRPLISTVAETLFHKVTKNRYGSYQLSSEYEVILTTHTGFVRKLSSISGSENDLANLCLRLAIATLRSNKLVGNLGFIILDEISSSFDEERTKQTLEGLLELKDIIPQIINITHKPVEMRFADRLITVKEQNGRASVIF